VGSSCDARSVATTEKLLALDTPSLYFRSFFGVPESVTAPDGTPVNAVRGLIDAIARLITTTQATRLVAAMDADWRPAWRVAALPSYKEHRVGKDGGDQSPDALNVQVPIIEAVLEAVGLRQIGVAGYEADDVIGTLATTPGCSVDIVTGDRDLFQLVQDDIPVRVLYTGRGLRNLDAVDEAWVAKKYGIPGRGYAEFATLRGDPSDGLPGVPGVGDKSAAALITRFGTVSGVVAAAAGDTDDGFPAGSRRKVLDARDYLERAHGVVQVVRDVAFPEGDDRIPAEPRHPHDLIDLSQRWGLDSPLNRLLAAMRQATTE
jgi:5'-3' exonuclease